MFFFFFQAEDGIRDRLVTGVQTCALPIYEASIINDIKYLSKPIFFDNGLKNNYTILFRNVNTNSENSSTFKKDNDHKLLSAILFETKYPLIKSDDKYVNYLTPILSARYSPNKTKNIKNLDRRLEYNNIFSLDRIGQKIGRASCRERV